MLGVYVGVSVGGTRGEENTGSYEVELRELKESGQHMLTRITLKWGGLSSLQWVLSQVCSDFF